MKLCYTKFVENLFVFIFLNNYQGGIMPRFFINPENIGETSVTIPAPDAVHIGRSLRMRIGDAITVCCGGIEYDCKIITISDNCVNCEIITSQRSLNEPDVEVTLFQAVPKGDKLDTIVQKAVELGVTRVCPVLTGRCVSRPDKKSFGKKLERLNRIALEAAKQSGRGIVPQVTELIGFDDCVKQLTANEYALVCYEGGGINLSEAGLKSNSTIGLFIGSEGGFDKAEVDTCISAGCVAIGLGRRILRCETAPLAALSIIMNLTGNI